MICSISHMTSEKRVAINSKSDAQLEELLLLTEQMQEELDQKDRTIRELKVQLDESLTLNERLNSENRAEIGRAHV